MCFSSISTVSLSFTTKSFYHVVCIIPLYDIQLFIQIIVALVACLANPPNAPE